jgi:hypothetical protein
MEMDKKLFLHVPKLSIVGFIRQGNFTFGKPAIFMLKIAGFLNELIVSFVSSIVFFCGSTGRTAA